MPIIVFKDILKDNINFKGILFLEMLIKEFNLLFNSLYNDESYEDGCNIKRNGLCQKYILNNEVVKIEGNVINNSLFFCHVVS